MVFQLGDEEDTSKGNILEILYDNAEHFETTPYSGAGDLPPWSSYNNSITKVTFNTSVAPISTAYWFSSMSNLEAIDNIYNLDTSNVTDMSNMFGYAGMRNLDLSSFDTSNVIYMDYMFFNCSNLVSLDLSGFDTYKLTSMLYMFAQCENLELLDLSSFYTSNVVTMSYMLDGLSNLRILKLGTNFAFQTTDSMLTGTWQRDGDNTIYTANELMNSYDGSTMAGTYRNTNMDIYVISYSNGEAVFQIGATPDPSKGSVRGSYSYVETYNSLPTYANNHTINTVTFDTVVSPTSASGFFSDLINLTTINNIENLNTSNTTDMSNMFADCNSLKSLDLSNFKINNGTKTSGMFNNTDSLATLKLGSNSIFNSSGTSLAGYWAKDGTKAVYKAPTLTKLYNGIPMSGTYRRKVKLTINEKVKGNLADTDKEFDFNILIFRTEGQNEIYYTEDIDYFGSKSGTIAVSTGSSWLKGLYLKHGQSVYMYVPYGSDYEYEIEQDNETYSLETTNESGDLSTDITASFIDTLNSPVPTGITSRNLIIYIVLFLITGTLIFIYLADRTRKKLKKQ